MAVKNMRPRYIGFRVTGGVKIHRKEMIRAIRSSFSTDEYNDIEPWLTAFDGFKGILRCRHNGSERARELLNDIYLDPGRVETVITSGTIKKVKVSIGLDR